MKRAAGYVRAKRPEGLIKVYLTAEAVLFLLVITAQMTGLAGFHTDMIKYAGIVLNAAAASFFYVLYGGQGTNGRHAMILLALFLTAAADLFLTLLGNEALYVPGVLLFCAVQLSYSVYLKWRIGQAAACLSVFAVLLIITGRFADHSLLTAAAILDISLLSVNAVVSWRAGGKSVSYLFCLGMTLFFCCDMTIGIRMLSSGALSEAAAFLVWVFYAPSQVCITLCLLTAS